MNSKLNRLVGATIQQAILLGVIVVAVAMVVQSTEGEDLSHPSSETPEHSSTCTVCQTSFRAAKEGARLRRRFDPSQRDETVYEGSAVR